MADYLPGPDAEYQAWMTNFVTYAGANLVALGLLPADLAPITSGQTAFNTNFAAHVAAVAAAKAAKNNKDDARTALTANVRSLVRRLQASPLVSDAEKAALGITVARDKAPVAAPTTRPIVSVGTAQRFEHTLSFVDSATPTRKAKPKGVIGVEVWAKVGTTPPADQAELRFMGLDSSTPAVMRFESTDGGKTAYYWTRWVTGTGERGPWSEQVSATIAA